MTWSIAFVIVGCTWAAVVFLMLIHQNEKDYRDQVRHLERRLDVLEKEQEWLSPIVRDKLCK